ncbi:MAG TPA: PAS domain-containing protein, partial [Burkholderiaceae bacterium]|nr:PAS domain-containing protein [Burkholderiaceae bacterium]
MSDPAALLRFILASPGMFVLLRPNADFTIVAASEEYKIATHTDASIIGRALFDVFPDNPALEDTAGSRSMRASMERVRATGQPDGMALVRYDVRRPVAEGGGFEERYWSPFNVPVLDADGHVEYILHRVEDATAKANFKAVEILESITEGFFTLDRQWRFDYVNAEAHRILGVER